MNQQNEHTDLQAAAGGSGIENVLTAVLEKGMSLMQAIGFEKDQLEFIYEYGVSLFKSGKYKEASNIFLFLCQMNGKDSRFPFAYASCMYRLKEIQAAIQFYSLAALLDGDNPATWFNLAECYMHLQIYDIALTMVNRCIDTTGVHPDFSKMKEEASAMRSVLLHYQQETSGAIAS